MYAVGFLRAKTAQVLMHRFWPQSEWDPKLLKRIRANLKNWEGIQSFRDHIYTRTIQNLDMSTPLIVQGVAMKAMGGDVPAAKFSLELTGRYQAKDQAPTAIQINFGEMPRPLAADYEGSTEDE